MYFRIRKRIWISILYALGGEVRWLATMSNTNSNYLYSWVENNSAVGAPYGKATACWDSLLFRLKRWCRPQNWFSILNYSRKSQSVTRRWYYNDVENFNRIQPFQKVKILFQVLLDIRAVTEIYGGDQGIEIIKLDLGFNNNKPIFLCTKGSIEFECKVSKKKQNCLTYKVKSSRELYFRLKNAFILMCNVPLLECILYNKTIPALKYN